MLLRYLHGGLLRESGVKLSFFYRSTFKGLITIKEQKLRHITKGGDFET